jgi:hypothetical protein
MAQGWNKESERHKLAKMGIRTNIAEVPQSMNTDEPNLEQFRGKNIIKSPKFTVGKFEGNFNSDFADALYNATLDGGVDEEYGGLNEGVWYGKMKLDDLDITEDGNPVYGVILRETPDGFFDYETFDTKEIFDKSWERISV